MHTQCKHGSISEAQIEACTHLQVGLHIDLRAWHQQQVAAQLLRIGLLGQAVDLDVAVKDAAARGVADDAPVEEGLPTKLKPEASVTTTSPAFMILSTKRCLTVHASGLQCTCLQWQLS